MAGSPGRVQGTGIRREVIKLISMNGQYGRMNLWHSTHVEAEGPRHDKFAHDPPDGTQRIKLKASSRFMLEYHSRAPWRHLVQDHHVRSKSLGWSKISLLET